MDKIVNKHQYRLAVSRKAIGKFLDGNGFQRLSGIGLCLGATRAYSHRACSEIKALRKFRVFQPSDWTCQSEDRCELQLGVPSVGNFH